MTNRALAMPEHVAKLTNMSLTLIGLASIEPRVFVDSVLALPTSAQGSVFTTLKARYDTGMLKRELSEEKSWLNDIKNEFEKRLGTLNPLSKFR
jgi:hypothetical protein